MQGAAREMMASGVLSSDQSWVLVNEHQNVLHAHLYFPRTEKEKKRERKSSFSMAEYTKQPLDPNMLFAKL